MYIYIYIYIYTHKHNMSYSANSSFNVENLNKVIAHELLYSSVVLLYSSVV